jgi:SAM-dependent methyltransferase
VAEIAGEQALQSMALEELTAAVNYRERLVGLAGRFLGDNALEIGSGNGDYAASFAARGHHLVASEALPERVEQLRSRFAREALVTVRELTLPAEEVGEYSAVIAYNVLEHIEDDTAALASMGALCRPGGHVIVLVPAFDFAMSSFDRRLGHFRRYRRSELEAKLQAAGLEPLGVRYVNCVGLLAWTVMVRLLHQVPRDTALLRWYDRHVLPLVARLEARVELPFGQSVFAVATRPER